MSTRIILCGVGGVGRNVTRLLNARPDYEVVAAYSRNPQLTGSDMGELAGIGPLRVVVTGDRRLALEHPADALVVATASYLRDVADDLRAGVDRGLDVVTTAEEAAFPWLADGELANELDRHAVDHDVSILGAGLNPGFIFDTLLLTLSGIAWDVRHIQVRRVSDISRFSATIQRRLGLGYSLAEFQSQIDAGAITGHIGFRQGFALVAHCMGRKLDRIEESFEPVVADADFETENLAVVAGQTAGFIQRTRGMVDGEPWIEAEFIPQAGSSSGGGYALEDSISIDGLNPVSLAISPACQPQLGTAAMIGNCIPRVIEARPGFRTVADLALPFARPTRSDLLRFD